MTLRRVPCAFSLVELLVVIAVIALLASLLLPVTTAARARGRAATCMSNLRQVGIAVQNYGISYGDTTPASFAWPTFLESCQDDAALRCPSDARPGLDISYGLNGNVIAGIPTLAGVRKPSETPLAFDSDHVQGQYYSDLAYRHAGHDAYVLYADMHVEPQFQEQALAFENAVPLPGGRPKRSFTLQSGVVTIEKDCTGTLLAVGGAFVGTSPIRALYRVNGGPAQYITMNARVPGQSVQLGALSAGDTVTVLAYVSGLPTYSSDDGSGHCWTLLQGDTVPSIEGYQGQDDVAEFLTSYVDGSGVVSIGSDAAIYLFELGPSINWETGDADFQDCVVVISFQ